MSKPRRLDTPNKTLVLATVAANPGLSANKIADVAGLLPCVTRRILQEMFASRLVSHLPRVPGTNQGKIWYLSSENGNS